MTDRRRALPAVNTLLAEAERAGLTAQTPRGLVVDAIREVLQEARRGGGTLSHESWLPAIERRVVARTRLSLRRVVNATGVVLHTNLGRAPLAEAAQRAMEGAFGYTTLELNRETGERGSRQDHVRALLRELTGADDALVVGNAAAALFLLLAAVAAGGETVVSRGELVEIGGAFRIPEILAKSGSILVEVGTTNRTRLRDYALAVSPRTRLFLKVHRSNFEITGFVAETAIADLVALGRDRAIPAAHDVGSGLLVSLERFGLSGEPLVSQSVAAGATVVFSGDKLLGGPQAGILVGPSTVVQQAARHPLTRALRPDKTVLAALEATLMLYRDPEDAVRAIPTLAMLTASPASLKRRARRLARRIPGATTMPGLSSVGGGAFPGVDLPTTLVGIEPASCDQFLRQLRANDPPVIARTAEGCVVFDVRTVADAELAIVGDAARAIVASGL